MRYSNMRRRVVAALAAGGLTTIAGVGRAGAQQTEPCQVISSEGTLENMQPNYWARADQAEFVFPVRMRAFGDQIALYAQELGGELTEGAAAIKGLATRQGDGALGVERLQINWPFTVARIDGQLYTVIQIAHEQQIPVGIVLEAGGNPLGEIVLEPGIYDPNQQVVNFSKEVSAAIHEGLMRNEGFSAKLAAGGTVYSAVDPDTSKYTTFFNETLPAAMDEARRKDALEPCAYVSPDEYLDAIEGCFLTSACCTVIGLDDDCWELATLRRFRDGYLRRSAEGRAEIARYYAEAPAIAARLTATEAGRAQLLRLYWTTILPAVMLARVGLNRAAHALYRRMMTALIA